MTKIRHFTLILLLAMCIATLQPTLTTALATAASGKTYCLQFMSSTKSGYMVANPQMKTIADFPEGAIPYPDRDNALLRSESPDGRYVAQDEFLPTTQQYRLVVEDRQTEKVFVVKTAAIFGMSWSNDGTQIAYEWQETVNDVKKTYVGITDVRTKQERQASLMLDATLQYADWMSWSADNQYIAVNVSHQNQLEILSVADLMATQFSPYKLTRMMFDWAPQGHRFAAWIETPDGSKLTIGSPEKGAQYEFLGVQGNGYNNLDWSPNGVFLANLGPEFNSDSSNQYPNQYVINIFNTLSGASWSDLPGPFMYNGEGGWLAPDIGWSADSEVYVFSRPRGKFADQAAFQGRAPTELVAAEPKTKTLHILASDIGLAIGRTPTVRTSNSSRLAVAIKQGGQSAVLLTNPDGSGQAILKTTGPSIRDLSWIADGQQVAYIAGDDRFSLVATPQPNPVNPLLSHLVWANADGTHEKSLAFTHLHILSWQPEKKVLIYFAGDADNNKVFALDPKNGVSVALTPALSNRLFEGTLISSLPEGAYGIAVGNWQFFSDPQQRRVVLTSSVHFSGMEGESTSERRGGATAYLSAWDGSALSTLKGASRYLGPIVWSPDGLMFAYTGEDSPGKEMIEVYSFEGQLLWEIANDRPANTDLVSMHMIIESPIWIPCD